MVDTKLPALLDDCRLCYCICRAEIQGCLFECLEFLLYFNYNSM